MLAVTTYDVVLALHVIAVIAAFGFSLFAPIYVPYVRRAHPRALPALHDLQYRMETRVTGPGILALFVLGAYLASENDLWDQSWVQVPITILVVIIFVGTVVVKMIKRLAELSRSAVGTAGGDVALGDEYEQLLGRYLATQTLLCALVLVAIFFMVAKPG